MNCTAFQKNLLASEHPDRLTARMTRHAAECAKCRLLHRRVVDLERQLPRIPTPPTTAGAALVHRLWAGEVTLPSEEPVSPLPTPAPLESRPAGWMRSMRERGLRKLAVALTLAASLLIFAIVWWAWPHPQPSRSFTLDPLAVRKAERDRLLAGARTPRERVQVLAALADNLQHEARDLARRAEGENLKLVARFYGELVRENLVAQARDLPPEQRQEVLQPVVENLRWTESNLQKLIAVEEPVSEPLRDIAVSALASHDLLCELLRETT
jgi:hypothetical protein